MEICRKEGDIKVVVTVLPDRDGLKFLRHAISMDPAFEHGSQFLVKGPVDIEFYRGWDDLNEIASDLEDRGNQIEWLISWLSSPLYPGP